MATFEEQVLDLTNQERAKNGLSPLQANAELNYTAEKYAKDMSDGHFFSHTGPDGSQPWDREKAAGYEAQVTGENIAVGQTTPQQVVQDWMNSPGHRANILRPQFKDLGVGFNNNYWVQDFGSGDTNPNSYIPSGSNSVASASNSTPTSTPTPVSATEPVSIPSATKSESTSNQGASPNSNQTMPSVSSDSYEPTAYEQYMLELINRARANPKAEEQRQGISLTEGGEKISYDPKQPLAWNNTLSKVAQDHNKWEDKTGKLSHYGEGGWPWERAYKAGYDMTGPNSSEANENIAFGSSSTPKSATQYAEERHNSLYASGGHRSNFFESNWKEAGIDLLGKQTSDGKNLTQASVVEEFGKPASGKTFLTGVVFNDSVKQDNFYTPGEGIGGVEVDAVRKSDNKTFTTKTTSSGGYQVALEPGEYDVTFLDGKTQPTKSTVKIDSQNVKVDDLVPDKKVNGVFHTNPDNGTGNGSDFLTGKQGEWQPQYDKGVLASNSFDDILVGGQNGNVDLINNLGTNATINETLPTMDHSQIDNGMVHANALIALGDSISNPSMIYAHASIV